ncbi:MAG: 23S rRNA (pseudouridine(1915)-N(3))-methyltransferase RlmH [Bacilli bacterium]|nr:23S rRNA (pseudouridine(1915)-N(3))-methyltransferase RlmH [Bacilli bacterium]
MKIKLLVVGTLKERYLKDAINEYLKRLSKYAHMEIIEVKEENDTKSNAKTLEGEYLLKKIDARDYVVALTLNAKEYTSEALAVWLDKTLTKARGNLVLVIGGSLGLSNSLLSRANDTLSLSKLTFTHQMTRLIVLEQLYRAFKINHHEKYHK